MQHDATSSENIKHVPKYIGGIRVWAQQIWMNRNMGHYETFWRNSVSDTSPEPSYSDMWCISLSLNSCHWHVSNSINRFLQGIPWLGHASFQDNNDKNSKGYLRWNFWNDLSLVYISWADHLIKNLKMSRLNSLPWVRFKVKN